MSFSVPTVDIGSYVRSSDPTSRLATAVAMDWACRDVGFVQIVGHGVPDGVVRGMEEALDSFFALDSGTKGAYRRPVGNRGYTPTRSESLSLSAGVAPAYGSGDAFEAFNVGSPASAHPGLDLPKEHYAENLWPAEVACFEHRVAAYFCHAQRVARTLTTVFADALGLSSGYFAQYTDHSIEVLRMNNYPLRAAPTASIGMGEHTDFGIVTVLWADPVPGLEVLGVDRRWHGVVPLPGALLVNIGDLLARWTNDRWRSTLHRVRPQAGGRFERRRSAAFFHDGNFDAVIRPLPQFGGDAESGGSIRVDEHIAAKLRGSRGGIVNASAVDEARRIASAAEP